MDAGLVDAVLADYRSAPISEQLRAAIGFLERLTAQPDEITAQDARRALDAGLTADRLRDAAAVAAVFSMITRNANALDFEVPSPADFDRAAVMLLRRGYGSSDEPR